MTEERKGGRRTTRGKHYARVRIGKGRRVTVAMPGVRDEDEADKRAAQIADVASVLVAADLWHEVKKIAQAMGAAITQREVRILTLAAERMAAAGPRIGSLDTTVKTFGEAWTTGALHRQYPDHVPAKDSRGDRGILDLYVDPVIGHLPLRAVTLDHADAVMRALPEGIGPARRRHVAQVVHRILILAAYPAKIIPASPLPKGWLPKLGPRKAMQYLYPDEDEALLGCTAIPLEYRVLYGVLNREGPRVSEALALDWPDLDLERGVLTLDENKSKDPRAWALDPYVVEALITWKRIVGGGRGPFSMLPTHHTADRLREHLKLTGIDRAELFRTSDARRQLRAHDLRATFVTLSLANGKTEAWVQDRTGHRSTLMIAKYRRSARTVAELGLGPLAPLGLAIPELRGGAKVGQDRSDGDSDENHDKSNVVQLVAPPGLEPGRPYGPKILKTKKGSRQGANRRKTGLAKTSDDASKRLRPTLRPTPPSVSRSALGLAREVVTWDAFEVLAAEEAGVKLPPKRRRR